MNEMNKRSKEINEMPDHYIADDRGYEQRSYLDFVYWLLFRASRHNFRKVDDTPTEKCWCWWLVTSCTLDGKMGDFYVPGNDNSLPRRVLGFRPSSKVRVKLYLSVPQRHIGEGEVWRHSFFKFGSVWRWAVNLTFRPPCPQEKGLPAPIEQDTTFWRR
jgi:hypothetical protein